MMGSIFALSLMGGIAGGAVVFALLFIWISVADRSKTRKRGKRK